MKTRQEWESYVRDTFENYSYFLLLGIPGTRVWIICLPDELSVPGGWAIKPKYSSFYIAFPKTYKDACDLAANCGWKIVSNCLHGQMKKEKENGRTRMGKVSE
jgi:hypothetical protein